MMKKFFKKISLGVIILTIVVGSFVGCNSAVPTNNDETIKQETTKETQGETKEIPNDETIKQETTKETQGEAKEISKVYIYQNSGAGTGPGSEAGSNEKDAEMVKNYIIDKVGVEPVIIMPAKGAEEQKLSLLLASGEKLDMFWGNWADYAGRGGIIPLNDIIDEYGKNIKEQWPSDTWISRTDAQGNIWAVPRNFPYLVRPVYVRTDWLEKYGLTMPTTIEEYENVLKTFKEKDPAGNGETIPMMTDIHGLRWGLLGAFTEHGYGRWKNEEGKIMPPELAPGFKEFLNVMNNWYKKGYIYKESFIMNNNKIREILVSNKVASHVAWYSNITLKESELQKNAPEANYDIASIKGPKGVSETVTYASSFGAMISRSSQNPEACIKLIDWMHADIANFLVADKGIKDVHWEYIDEETKSVEAINQDKPVYFGEYNLAQGIMEFKVNPADKSLIKHYDYLRNELVEFSRGKKAVDFATMYDTSKINDKVTTNGDINRMIEEETIKFIMGARPLSEYEQFVEELKKIGLDKLIDAYTEQYKQQNQ